MILVLALGLTLGLTACQGTFSSSAVDDADAPAAAVEAAVGESTATKTGNEIRAVINTAAEVIFTSPETHYIVLENGRFLPSDLEIKAGDIVEWVNKDGNGAADNEDDERSTDDEGYTVTFTDGSFDEVLPAGAILRMAFTEAGEYWYVNQLEAGMRGRVVVK